MKNLFATVMLWAMMSMPILHAQVPADTLHITEQNKTVVQIISANIHKVRDNGKWAELLESFRSQLDIVQEQVPDYEQYKIQYFKDRSLTIEDDLSADEVLQYNIQSGEVIPISKTSVARLFDKTYEIRIYFTELEELSERNYTILIESAFAKMKTYSKYGQRFKDVLFQIDNIYYNNSSAEISKKYANKSSIFLDVDATIGIHRNEPIVNLNFGLGFDFGRRNENSLFLTANQLLQYDSELNKGVNQWLFGGIYKPFKFLGVGYSRPINQDENSFFDIESRWSLILNLVIGGEFVLNFNKDFSGNRNVGFEFAIPFFVKRQ